MEDEVIKKRYLASANKNKYLDRFKPANRVKTYNKVVKHGYVSGAVVFSFVCIFSGKDILNRKFDILYVIYPIVAMLAAYLLISVLRLISRRIYIKNKENEHGLYKGISESIFRYIGAFMFSYYFLSLFVFLVSQPFKK